MEAEHNNYADAARYQRPEAVTLIIANTTADIVGDFLMVDNTDRSNREDD